MSVQLTKILGKIVKHSIKNFVTLTTYKFDLINFYGVFKIMIFFIILVVPLTIESPIYIASCYSSFLKLITRMFYLACITRLAALIANSNLCFQQRLSNTQIITHCIHGDRKFVTGSSQIHKIKWFLFYQLNWIPLLHI